MGKSRVTCLMMDSSVGEYLMIADPENNYVEYRMNNEPPFNWPLDGIVDGYLFIVTTEVKPGSMNVKVDKAEVSDYLHIIQNQELLDNIEETAPDGFPHGAEYHLNKIIEDLRNKKIDKVLK